MHVVCVQNGHYMFKCKQCAFRSSIGLQREEDTCNTATRCTWDPWALQMHRNSPGSAYMCFIWGLYVLTCDNCYSNEYNIFPGSWQNRRLHWCRPHTLKWIKKKKKLINRIFFQEWRNRKQSSEQKELFILPFIHSAHIYYMLNTVPVNLRAKWHGPSLQGVTAQVCWQTGKLGLQHSQDRGKHRLLQKHKRGHVNQTEAGGPWRLSGEMVFGLSFVDEQE